MALSPGLNTATAELASRLRASTVEVRTEGHGAGSGVIWKADGLIVTNHHVARRDTAEVVLADGRTLQGRVTSRDPGNDLAALRVDARDLPAAVAGDSGALRVGQLVLAMGHPFGVTGALTMGIVHAVDSGPRAPHIRADLRLAPGNSGGPMADARGRVVGINSMVAGGLALAVPSATVERFLIGLTRPAFLGVETQVVTFPRGFGGLSGPEQESGLLVLGVVEGGPAARNGLLPGDILLGAASTPLNGADDLVAVLREHAVGTPLPLVIARGGRRLEVTAILGEREARAA